MRQSSIFTSAEQTPHTAGSRLYSRSPGSVGERNRRTILYPDEARNAKKNTLSQFILKVKKPFAPRQSDGSRVIPSRNNT